MATDEQTSQALDLTKLQLPPSPPVSGIQWEDYQDSTGEPSLRLQIVLAEKTDVGALTGEQIGELKAAIRESLMSHGVSKFPYIFITTAEELAEPVGEE